MGGTLILQLTAICISASAVVPAPSRAHELSTPPTLPLRWRTLEPMPLPVFDAAAGLSGEWLVVSGGFTDDLSTTPAIQVRSENRGWRPIGTQLAEPRAQHSQTVLPDGRVLVVGGLQGSLRPDSESTPLPLASAEVFHPLIAGSDFVELDEPLVRHTAHLLPDGRVVIIGGSWARFFDHTAGSFTEAVRLRRPRRGHASVLWNRVVPREVLPSTLAGEQNESVEYTLVEQELSIDMIPTARGASIGATMEPQRVPVEVIADRSPLPTRLVLLIIGGEDESSIEELDLETGRSRLWNVRLPDATSELCATTDVDGRLLLIGGVEKQTSQSTGATWWANPDETLTHGPDLDLTLGCAGATCFVDVADGSIVMLGGEERDPDSITSLSAGRMIRRAGNRVFSLPAPRSSAPFTRRSWIRFNDREVVAVGGYRFVDVATAAETGLSPGIYVRGMIDLVRMPSSVGGD